jgi:hypothetical protein
VPHCGVMSDTLIDAKPANPKAGEWAERIAAQQRSGMSVKQFCKEQRLTEYSFYAWRKRLQEGGPVRFRRVGQRRERPCRRISGSPARILIGEPVCAAGHTFEIWALLSESAIANHIELTSPN